jgi:hypothetical protein
MQVRVSGQPVHWYPTEIREFHGINHDIRTAFSSLILLFLAFFTRELLNPTLPGLHPETVDSIVAMGQHGNRLILKCRIALTCYPNILKCQFTVQFQFQQYKSDIFTTLPGFKVSGYKPYIAIS